MKISILIPVYNEEKTIQSIIKNVNHVLQNNYENNFEIIVINDGSTDNSENILMEIKESYSELISLKKNVGKGNAIKLGIEKSKGEIVIIQDADLEYDPNEYTKLLKPFFEYDADIVYGSRFKSSEVNRVLFFWHSLANKLITFCSNVFSDLNLTDVETGYKAFKKKILDNIDLQEKSFGIEIELTHKISNLKVKPKFFEVGIRYNGRTYEEGKKIGLKDAFRALYCILKYGFVYKFFK